VEGGAACDYFGLLLAPFRPNFSLLFLSLLAICVPWVPVYGGFLSMVGSVHLWVPATLVVDGSTSAVGNILAVHGSLVKGSWLPSQLRHLAIVDVRHFIKRCLSHMKPGQRRRRRRSGSRRDRAEGSDPGESRFERLRRPLRWHQWPISSF
jgi:hypothetical protein